MRLSTKPYEFYMHENKKIYFHINETEAWGYSEMANKETQIRGGGGTPHMKGVGMRVGNFELNP